MMTNGEYFKAAADKLVERGISDMAISSTVNVHDVKTIRASSTRTMGAPLRLTLADARGNDAEIIIFTNDQAYTDALIAAINGVNDAREADKVVVALEAEAA